MTQSAAAQSRSVWADAPTVEGTINYVGPMDVRPEFFARDYSRDNLNISPAAMPVHDMRGLREGVSLDREGFKLVDHVSTVADFRNEEAVRGTYLAEVRELIKSLTGADRVVTMRGAILRFGERSAEYRKSFNSRPARFVHIDITPVSTPGLVMPLLDDSSAHWPPARRVTGYNIWRVISEPPQDVPLSVCDLTSIDGPDRVPADAVFDPETGAGFSFEAYVLRHNPRHRWAYFSNMTRDEALIFKNFDSAAHYGGGVPHVAFDDPACPPDTAPRASIETRAFALFD